MKTKIVVLLFACSCMAAAYGQGTLQITFDGPPVQPPNTQVGVTNYFERGMSFRPLPGVNGLVRNGGGISFYPADGSAYLQGLLGNALMFSFTNGLVFGLVSVDLAEYSTVLSGPTTVEFLGYHPDGSTVTTSFTTDGIIDGTGPLADFQTFSFNGLGFTNLTRVEIPSSDWSLDNLAVSPEVAETWTQASATTNYYWFSVAMSADGCKLAAVGSTDHPIFSTDGGATWHTNQSSPHSWNSIASSADGTKLVAPMVISNNYANFGIFVSTNSGGTWTQTTAPLSSWQSVASSGVGDRLGAIMADARYLNSIYVSTNSGLSWNKGGSPSNNWTSLACSADGTKFIATASGDKIYVSTNFGTTWTATTSPNARWTSVACNADGTRLIASGSGTYTSTNSGGSWRLASTNTGAVASSADGTKLIIAGDSTFTSSDSGVTWISRHAPYSWYCVASSADGSEWMVGAKYQPGIWIGRTMPSPQLNLGLVSNNIALSWVVPSTNFALQQTADLKTPNWVSLTNTPSLNPSNLQEQVTLPPSNGGGFFRLIAQ